MMKLEDHTIHEMALCEQDHVILRPNTLYIFQALPGCARCAELNRLWEEQKNEQRQPMGKQQSREGC